MDLIYSMRRRPLKCEPPRFDSATDSDTVRPLCTISTANIIAFSSPTELDDVDGDTWGGHVYVCDLDTPWDSHKVASTSHPVSALEWDIKGDQLLIATTAGDVSVYGQKEYLLNDWQCLYSTSFPGEHIIQSAFFHNGRRIIALDKKPEVPVTERFQILRSTPTLKGFGGVACVGACIITATGLVGVVVPNTEGAVPTTATEALRSTRDHITAASIAYKNGNLVVSVISAGSCLVLRCYLCCVRSPPLTVACQPLQAVHHLADVHATISWTLREDADSLLIGGSSLSLWKCIERAHPVHKLLNKGPLQGSTTPGGGQKPGSDSYNSIVWQKSAVWPIEGTAVSVSSRRLSVAPPHALLATPRSLTLLAQHVLCTRVVPTQGPGASEEPPGSAGASPLKKTKYGPGSNECRSTTVTHATLSWLGGVAVCVDSAAQLHVYKLPQPTDTPTAMSVQHATSLLEYCLISGYDCLDFLMTLKQNFIEPLYERFTESFQRQPPPFQQYYYHGWLKIRMALCRLSPCLQASASWLTCIQSCLGVVATLAASRGDEPALDDDDDKSLLALEAKPELISDPVSLQAMRLGLQRGVDIAITAIAQLASPPHAQHGYEMWTEPGALSALRRIVSAARACGRAPELVWRALPRLATDRHKLDLYDDCGAIAAQLQSARVWEALPRCSVSAPHMKPLPLYLEYGVEPESLRYAPEPPPYAQCDATTPPQAMDSIRYMYLGGGWRTARWRSCGRCGARALAAAQPQRHPLQRAHDGRYLPHCRCGGKWALCTNV